MTSRRTLTLTRALAITGAVVVITAGLVQGSGANASSAWRTASSPSTTASISSTTAARPLTASQIRAAKPGTLFPGGLATQPDTKAAAVVAELTGARKTAEAKAIAQISSQPVSVWLGDWYTIPQLKTVMAKAFASAAKSHRTPTFVTYAIPDRDCGGYSAGGLTPAQYATWNAQVASSIKGHRAAVIVEPDALAMISNCPSVAKERLPIVRAAVKTLAAAGATTYLDAGNSHWVAPATMATRLEAAGIGYARGFSTNVSNFYPLPDERAYGNKVSTLTGGTHFVVDVSRNGRGWKGTWCNPGGAGLGINPRVGSGRTKIDALLWVKTPGASDGTCNGGPSAGTWWQSYALALVKNRTAR